MVDNRLAAKNQHCWYLLSPDIFLFTQTSGGSRAIQPDLLTSNINQHNQTNFHGPKQPPNKVQQKYGVFPLDWTHVGWRLGILKDQAKTSLSRTFVWYRDQKIQNLIPREKARRNSDEVVDAGMISDPRTNGTPATYAHLDPYYV